MKYFISLLFALIMSTGFSQGQSEIIPLENPRVGIQADITRVSMPLLPVERMGVSDIACYKPARIKPIQIPWSTQSIPLSPVLSGTDTTGFFHHEPEAAQQIEDSPTIPYDNKPFAEPVPTGNVIVYVEDGKEAEAHHYFRQHFMTIAEELPNTPLLAARLPDGYSYEEFLCEASASGLFRDIEQDMEVECRSHSLPNDPLTGNCWYIKQTNDKDIDADIAWDNIPAWAQPKVIAIIDGHGFDTGHADLAGNVAGSYNTFTNSTDVSPENASDKHGTPCAAIPAAIFNNALGTPGLCKNLVTVLCIKIGHNIQSSGSFTSSFLDQAEAWDYCIGFGGVEVASCSWGTTSFSSSVNTSINNANSEGITSMGSTGNAGLATWTNYPASYAGVLDIGSSTSGDLRSSFSNYSQDLFCVAPGSGITTLDITGTPGYSTTDYNMSFSGTSAACPVAAAIAVMTATIRPDVTVEQRKAYLAAACEKVSPATYTYSPSAAHPLSTWDNQMGYGRLNMNLAVLAAIADSSGSPPPADHLVDVACSVNPQTFVTGSQVAITATVSTATPLLGQDISTIAYLFSTDNVADASDILIGTDVSTLGNGIASETESINYVTPPGITGTRYVLVVGEDVTCVSEVTITPAPAVTIDGELTFVPGWEPPTFTCNSRVTVKMFIACTGTAPMTSYNVSFGWNGILITHAQNFSTPLQPGSHRTISLSAPVQMGFNMFTSQINTINGVADQDPLNNSLAGMTVREDCQSNATGEVFDLAQEDPDDVVIDVQLVSTTVYTLSGQILDVMLPGEEMGDVPAGIYIISEQYTHGVVISHKYCKV